MNDLLLSDSHAFLLVQSQVNLEVSEDTYPCSIEGVKIEMTLKKVPRERLNPAEVEGCWLSIPLAVPGCKFNTTVFIPKEREDLPLDPPQEEES